MAHKTAIESAGASGVGKASVFRRLGRPMALAAAALAAALLMAPPASAQLFTSSTSVGDWLVASGTAGRWATESGGPFLRNYVSGSNTSFTTAGTYTFNRLATGSATLGDITTGTGVNISFTNNSGQQLNFVRDGGAAGTLDFGAGSVVDFGSIATIAGNGFVKNGAGTLVLTGGAYTGGFTLNAGNVIARGGNAFGTGAFTINGGAIGATSNFTASTSRAGSPIAVGGNFQIGIADSPASNTANMTFSTAAGNGFNLTGSARTITLGSSGSMTFGQAITNGSLTLNRLASGSAGQFALSASNSISSLTLDSVTVNASGTNAVLGNGSVTLQGDSATTLNIRAALTLANNFTIADSAGTKTITNFVSNATINGTITNNDSTGGLVIGAASGRIFTIGAIDGSGSKAVTFGGSGLSGAVVVTGLGTYTGNTVIDGSILKMSTNDSSVSTANLVFQRTSGPVTPTFDLNGSTQTVAGLSETGTAVGLIRSTLSGGKLIVGGSSNSTFAGTIISVNSMALEKVGTGKLTLTGANTYTNGTTITAGELEVSSQSLKGGVVINNVNATLTFNQASGDGTFAGDIGGNGSLIKKGNDALTLAGGNTYRGGTTVSAGSLVGTTSSLQGPITNNAAVTFDQSDDDTYSGVMSGSGSLTKLGSGAVTLTGANTYSGGTTVTAGSLVGTTSSLQGAITNNAGVTFDQATSGTYAGAMSGSGALTKLGSGTVTLSGANTYAGATLVSAGKLLVNGSLINSAVTVGSGATLGGSGSLGALLTVLSGGVLSPGNSPGALAAAALDLRAGSTTLMQVIGSGGSAGTAGSDYDQVQIGSSGSLTYGSTLNLEFGNGSSFADGTIFDLFTFTASPVGYFSSVVSTGSGVYAGLTFAGVGGLWTSVVGAQQLTFSELTGRLTVAFAAVPEIDPAMGASALSLVAGVLAMLEQRRRR